MQYVPDQGILQTQTPLPRSQNPLTPQFLPQSIILSKIICKAKTDELIGAESGNEHEGITFKPDPIAMSITPAESIE